MSRSRTVEFTVLAGFIGLCFVAAAIGGAGSMQAPEFYRQLVQPSWAPPAWLFGPAWTLLYTLMAVSAWLVWRQGPSPQVRKALALFFVQLALNALWSWLFFAWRLGGPAFGEILMLWSLIALMIAAFRPISGVSALLLLPYLAWVAFAAALNFSLWQGNPGLLG